MSMESRLLLQSKNYSRYVPRKEMLTQINRNSRTFSTAVWKLMRILSKWPTHTHRDGKTGITLELAVFSPSDSQHAHKDFRLEQNYPYHETRDIDRTFDAYKLRRAETESSSDHVNSPDHSWVHADPQKELGAKVRLLGLLQYYLKDSLVSQGFPTVKVVTGLLIRRQFYRKIPAQCVSTLLYEVCPCIEWFRHEGWHYVHPKLQSTYQNRKSTRYHGSLITYPLTLPFPSSRL